MSINNIIHHEPQDNRPEWTTPFWPRLRDSLLEDPEFFNHLQLECGICLTDMSIFPHEHTFSPEGLTPEKKTMSHRARILPCGHMFGNKCLHTMIEEATKDLEVGEIPEIACPACRVIFSSHSDCLHFHTGKFMPTTMEGVYAIPPTFSEGGVLLHSCGNCLAVDVISAVASLAPMFIPPLELTDREALVTYGTTANLHYWGIHLGDNQNVFEEFVREIPLGDALQRICNEITDRLMWNSTKRWHSEGFAGLKFQLMLYRDNRPLAIDYWRDVEVLENGEMDRVMALNLD
jgi:hypothetical protein